MNYGQKETTLSSGTVRLQRIYLKLLAICYATGAVLHGMDLLDLRLKFSEMNPIWKIWTVALLVLDSVAALGLWRYKAWGTVVFLLIASAQLLVYQMAQDIFGAQPFLILFHTATLSLWLALRLFATSKSST